MYWALDVYRFRVGREAELHETLYFKNKAEAVAWKLYYNVQKAEENLIARDLREENEEGLTVVLDNYFKNFFAQNRVTQKDLHKFCGI